jgi:PAS domain S-box-containing protein
VAAVSLPPEELSVLFDRSPIGMFRATEAGEFRAANPALARMLGYESVAELMTKNLTRDVYVDPATRRHLHATYRHTGGVFGVKLPWKRKDGGAITVQLWGHVIESREPSFDGWIVDVTAQDQQRADLQRTITTLDLVLRLARGIYWRIDTDLRILEVGGAKREVLGYDGPGQYIGRTIPEHQEAQPPSVDSPAVHARALRGEIVTLDSSYKDKLLASTIGPLYDDDGKIIGAIGAAVDVTRSRQLERRMIDAQRAESLGVMAGGLAHDFNNLLVAVLGNAELALRELPSGASSRGAIESIRDAALRAAELTDQLLAFAGRAGAGTTRVLPAPLVAELLRIVAPTMPREVNVHVDLPEELALRGDPGQVRQVLLNLIGNARDALGGAGDISISARAVEHRAEEDPGEVLAAPPGSYVRIEVSDDGPGMTPETRRRVFEPFFTTKPTGHGLGLAAVLGIVRAHGGAIRVRSSPGEGTTFQILWPTASRIARASSQPPVGARTVLVVDDEILVRDVVAQMVRDLGYDAVTAADGPRALEVIAKRAIDAVLVDLTMPGMSGADVVRVLREKQPGLPVVLCSGYDRDGRGPVAADAYLAKPFRIDALERTLAKLLPLRSV